MSPRPRPPSFGGPSPRSRCTVPCWVPAGTRMRLAPFRVGTPPVAPAGRAAAAPERGGVEATEDAAARVVLLALLGVGQDRVRALDLLEALLGGLVAGVAVRVVLARELAVRLLDVLLRRLLVDAEDLVW